MQIHFTNSDQIISRDEFQLEKHWSNFEMFNFMWCKMLYFIKNSSPHLQEYSDTYFKLAPSYKTHLHSLALSSQTWSWSLCL